MSLQEILFAILLWVLSILITWLITHLYYLKSLEHQGIEFQNSIEPLKEELKDSKNDSKALLNEERIEKAVKEYRKKNPKDVIDTYDDLTKNERAKMYDLVVLRARGRKAKNNPYK